jgi:hypothetical protein
MTSSSASGVRNVTGPLPVVIYRAGSVAASKSVVIARRAFSTSAE